MSWADITNSVLGVATSVFGQDVIYTPANGSPKTIRGIFESKFEEVDPQLGVVVSSEKPNLGIRLSDLDADPVKGDQVTVGDITYYIRESQSDGNGCAVLILSEA